MRIAPEFDAASLTSSGKRKPCQVIAGGSASEERPQTGGSVGDGDRELEPRWRRMARRDGAYTVRIHREPGAQPWAEIAELPGLVVTGKDMDELHQALTEAITSSQPASGSARRIEVVLRARPRRPRVFLARTRRSRRSTQ